MHIRDSLPDLEQLLGIRLDVVVAGVFGEQVRDLVVLEASRVDDRGTESV
jgi:hypothetical protein